MDAAVGDPVAGSDQSACRNRWPDEPSLSCGGPTLSGPSDPGRIPITPHGSVEARLSPLARWGGRLGGRCRALSCPEGHRFAPPPHRAAGGPDPSVKGGVHEQACRRPPATVAVAAAAWRRPAGAVSPWRDPDERVFLAAFWPWRLHAACRGVDTELFYSPEGERGLARTARVRAAKAICATCPVKAPCAAYALQHQERYGVWGGLTESERAFRWSQAAAAAH